MRIFPLIFLTLTFGCSTSDAIAVENPQLCKARTETRLGESWKGDMSLSSTETYQQLVFDSEHGDQKLARDFMWQNGFWPAMNAPGEKDFAFLPFTDPKTSPRVGDPAKGVELACRASWVSKVPFLAVEVRSKSDGSLLKKVPAN